jgi:hypothetical protein
LFSGEAMLKRIRAGVVAAVLGALVSGCGGLSAVAYKVVGDPKTPAEYKPAADKATLVLVENFKNPDQYRVESTLLERDIAAKLRENKAAKVVPGEKLEDLRSADGAGYRKMKVNEVGKAVGAKQVIYVNLSKFSTESAIGSTEMAGKAEALVRVIDVESGRVLWPSDNSAGREVKYETKHEEAVDFSDHGAVQEQISQSLGERIARLFYAAAEAENGVGPKK